MKKNKKKIIKKNLKIVCTIQARMNSNRLPGKVMKKINNKPMIELLYSRVQKSKFIDEIIVATSKNKNDDVLVKFLEKKKIKYFRGSENNVLKRLTEAVKYFKAEIIIQLTGDNPLVDPKIIDYMINFYLKNYPKYLYVTNNGFSVAANRKLPLGMDVQIFRFKDLNFNFKRSFKKDLKEHPSLYFYREGAKRYNIKNIYIPKKWQTEIQTRLTVDTKKDFKLVSLIFKKLGDKSKNLFTYEDIIKFFKKNPKYANINKDVIQKKVKLN